MILNTVIVFSALAAPGARADYAAGVDVVKVASTLGFAHSPRFERVIDTVHKILLERRNEPPNERWMLNLTAILPDDKFRSTAYFEATSRVNKRHLQIQATFEIESGALVADLVVHERRGRAKRGDDPQDLILQHPTLVRTRPRERLLKTIGYQARVTHRRAVPGSLNCDVLLAKARSTDNAEILRTYTRRGDPRVFVDLVVRSFFGTIAGGDDVRFVHATYAIKPDGSFAFAASANANFTEAARW